jgi:hypothetical protein
MTHDPTSAADELDALLDGCDPIERSKLTTGGIEKALDDLGAAITSTSVPAPQPVRRRLSFFPRSSGGESGRVSPAYEG